MLDQHVETDAVIGRHRLLKPGDARFSCSDFGQGQRFLRRRGHCDREPRLAEVFRKRGPDERLVIHDEHVAGGPRDRGTGRPALLRGRRPAAGCRRSTRAPARFAGREIFLSVICYAAAW